MNIDNNSAFTFTEYDKKWKRQFCIMRSVISRLWISGYAKIWCYLFSYYLDPTFTDFADSGGSGSRSIVGIQCAGRSIWNKDLTIGGFLT